MMIGETRCSALSRLTTVLNQDKLIQSVTLDSAVLGTKAYGNSYSPTARTEFQCGASDVFNKPPDIQHIADGVTIGHLQSLLIDHVTHTCADFRRNIVRITGKIPEVRRGESLRFSVLQRAYVVIDLPIRVRSTATPLAPLVRKLTG